MKLTRVVHMGGTQVFYGPVGDLIPDVALVGHEPGEGAADRALMFVDAGGNEAHAFLFTEAQLRELAESILRPHVEIVRTFPGGMLNGGAD